MKSQTLINVLETALLAALFMAFVIFTWMLMYGNTFLRTVAWNG